MTRLQSSLAIVILSAVSVGVGSAQPPGDPFLEPTPQTPVPGVAPGTLPAPATLAAPAPVPSLPQTPIAEEVEHYLAQIDDLRKEQSALQAGAQTEDQKKRVELLQKQVETLEKMVRLLADQLKKQPGAGPGMEQLQIQAATLEARSVQAARRDQELAGAIDDLREHLDAEQRYGPRLPAALKELFLLSGTNETPLSIYGALSVGYSRIVGNAITAANGTGRADTPGGFSFNEFSPDFFLNLNDWIFMEAEISVGSGGAVEAPFAQVDFIVNDWLTIVAGKFVAPIGWFNERLNNPWINKLPTDPLTAMQVLPGFSLLGVQARGAFYLGCSPIKMEYSAYVSNGLNLTPAAGTPDINELANLENMTETENIISNEKAFGGRIGLWYPEAGLEVGLSGMTSGDYVAGGFEDKISIWAVDLNYHKGNWDARAEYAMTLQQAKSFAGTPGLTADTIRRQGIYAQVAYRPRDCGICYLENVELVYRYGYVDFKGIDPTALDLSTFDSPVDVPVRRQQNEFGINYYFYPRMVLKVAYQVNDEPGFHLHDNQFISELAWGW